VAWLAFHSSAARDQNVVVRVPKAMKPAAASGPGVPRAEAKAGGPAPGRGCASLACPKHKNCTLGGLAPPVPPISRVCRRRHCLALVGAASPVSLGPPNHLVASSVGPSGDAPTIVPALPPALQCVKCPSGSYAESAGNNASSAVAASCVAKTLPASCPAGEKLALGSSATADDNECVQCEVGAYSGEASLATTCSAKNISVCAAGQYFHTTGSATVDDNACFPCPRGTYSASVGLRVRPRAPSAPAWPNWGGGC